MVYVVRVSAQYSPTEYYSIPEIADFIGVRQRDVRGMIRDNEILAVRRGENNALLIYGGQLVEKDGTLDVLGALRGTIIQLRDLGLDDEAIHDWIMTESDELGTSPLEALRNGNIHGVRRTALTSIA